MENIPGHTCDEHGRFVYHVTKGLTKGLTKGVEVRTFIGALHGEETRSGLVFNAGDIDSVDLFRHSAISE